MAVQLKEALFTSIWKIIFFIVITCLYYNISILPRLQWNADNVNMYCCFYHSRSPASGYADGVGKSLCL